MKRLRQTFLTLITIFFMGVTPLSLQATESENNSSNKFSKKNRTFKKTGILGRPGTNQGKGILGRSGTNQEQGVLGRSGTNQGKGVLGRNMENEELHFKNTHYPIIGNNTHNKSYRNDRTKKQGHRGKNSHQDSPESKESRDSDTNNRNSTRTSVYVLLYDDDWNCLIARKRFVYRFDRKKNSTTPFTFVRQAGQWVLPGGETDEDNSNVLKNAEREFKEETGHDLSELAESPYNQVNFSDDEKVYTLVMSRLKRNENLGKLSKKINEKLKESSRAYFIKDEKKRLHHELAKTEVVKYSNIRNRLGKFNDINEEQYKEDKRFHLNQLRDIPKNFKKHHDICYPYARIEAKNQKEQELKLLNNLYKNFDKDNSNMAIDWFKPMGDFVKNIGSTIEQEKNKKNHRISLVTAISMAGYLLINSPNKKL